MKKLTSMLEQVNEKSFSETIVENIKKELKNSLLSLGLEEIAKKYAKNRMIKYISFFVGLGIGIGGIALIFNSNFPAGIALIVVGVIAFIIAVFFGFEAQKAKNVWKSTIEKYSDHSWILKKLIEDKYENVKFISSADNRYYSIAQNYHSNKVPSDAVVIQDFGGLDFTVNNRYVSTRALRWHWVRTYSDGKRTYVQNYYENDFYVISIDIPERFKNFQLTFKPNNGILTKGILNKGKELENDFFNKAFSYEHNDPINLRILFTPFVQEMFVNNFKDFDFNDSATFLKTSDYYVWVNALKFKTPFTLNAPILSDLEKVIEHIIKDAIEDATYFLDHFSILVTLRELVYTVDR